MGTNGMGIPSNMGWDRNGMGIPQWDTRFPSHQVPPHLKFCPTYSHVIDIAPLSSHLLPILPSAQLLPSQSHCKSSHARPNVHCERKTSHMPVPHFIPNRMSRSARPLGQHPRTRVESECKKEEILACLCLCRRQQGTHTTLCRTLPATAALRLCHRHPMHSHPIHHSR